MQCPYCGSEMKPGKIYTACNSAPYWQEDGKKRSVLDAVEGTGVLRHGSTATKHTVKGNYCPVCRKIIIDADFK